MNNSTVFAADVIDGQKISSDYALSVNGTYVPVYLTRVSAYPINQCWPGYERPLYQTEFASYSTFDFTGKVTVSVRVLSKKIETLTIRPLDYEIEHEINGDTVTFTIDRPMQISFEVNGFHSALLIFANAMENFSQYKGQPGVRYYGPGVHNVGLIELTDNETVVLDHGAVFKGGIKAVNAENLKVIGRGMIDCSDFVRSGLAPEGLRYKWPQGCVNMLKCKNILFDGVMMNDSNGWTATMMGCDNAVFNNVKLIGMWKYNSDGIDLCNCRNCEVRNSFLRTYDDGVVFKGVCYNGNDENGKPYMNEQDVDGCEISNCVFWCDWGRAIEIGVESYCEKMGNIHCKNCKIIHAAHVGLDIFIGHRAVVHDVSYEDITMEIDDGQLPCTMQTYKGEEYKGVPGEGCPPVFVGCIFRWDPQPQGERGHIKNISLKNINVRGKKQPNVELKGFDEDHIVENITLENICFNGKSCRTAEEMKLVRNEFTKDVKII